MIPKKIHYCWFGGKEMPNEVKKCIETWKKYCPNYELIKWDETNFDINSHPFVKAAYEAKAWAFVSDYARLRVIYDNGGIYLDTDVELLKNLDFLLDNQSYIGVQQDGHLCNTGLGYGASKTNPVVEAMLKMYDSLDFSLERKAELACPNLNHAVLKELGYQYSEKIWQNDMVTVYPCRYFDPIAPGETQNLFCEDTVSIHHYAASWTGTRNRIKRKIFRLVGEENIHKVKTFLKRLDRRKCVKIS